MRKIYIDSSSSDEEKENQVINKINKVNYYSYLLNNVLTFKYINNADEFEAQLGLTLNNLVDRLFRSSAINNIYQEIKAKKLGLKDDTYNKILNNVKTVFNKQLNQLFTDNNKENPITDEDYIQLFNFLFDKNVKLPNIFTPKNDLTTTKIKKTLIEELQKNKEINLKFLFQNNLKIKINSNNSAEILACSKITNRNNKNKIKYLTVQETKNYSSSTSYDLSNSELPAFTDSHVIHYETGNVQTEIFGLGTYKEIFQRILRNEVYKENIVKRIFEVVQNKEITNAVKLPTEFNNFAEQLAHLFFIVEPQRSKVTTLIAPMFLELISKDNKYLKTDFFPMATHTAVSQARGVAYSYPFELPNSHFMDYDTHNISQGSLLLRKEGNVFIEWLKEVIGNDKLNNIAQILNLIHIKKVLQEKEIDSIKLQELQTFLNYIKKLTNYPANLIKEVEENLNNLIPHFGSRPEQYLLLFKEALLKKSNFSDKIKALIETTFSEFQKVLPKLDSFLTKVQANLEKDIKEILPEILQILCAKIKEWYNIDAPGYITNIKTVEEASNREVFKDITLQFNQTISPKSSKPRLKLSLKRKNLEDEDNYDGNKILKINDAELDKTIEEALKLIGANYDDSIPV